LGSVLEEHKKGDGSCYTGKDEGEDHSDDLVVSSSRRVRDRWECEERWGREMRGGQFMRYWG